MIWESWAWKREVAIRTKALERRRSQKRWSQASLTAVERDVFLVAYAVRKLLDAFKLSDEVEGRSIDVLAYPPTGRAVDFMNWDRLDVLYHLDEVSSIRIGLREFCNQIIHSFVFIVSIADSGALEGLFISSDRDKDRRLLYFALDTVTDALWEVVRDDVVSVLWVRDGVGAPARYLWKSRHYRRADSLNLDGELIRIGTLAEAP